MVLFFSLLLVVLWVPMDCPTFGFSCCKYPATALIISYWMPIQQFYIHIYGFDHRCHNYPSQGLWCEWVLYRIFHVPLILGLLIVAVVIFFEGAPAQYKALGFHDWNDPGELHPKWWQETRALDHDCQHSAFLCLNPESDDYKCNWSHKQ